MVNAVMQQKVPKLFNLGAFFTNLFVPIINYSKKKSFKKEGLSIL